VDVSLHDALREAADPSVLMHRVAEQAIHLIPAADGASLEIRVDDEMLEYVAAVGTLEPFGGLRLGIRGSLSGLAVLTGSVTRTDDARVDPRADPEAISRTGVVSLLALPLRSNGDRIAVLKVTSQQPGAFTASDDHVLSSLADFVRSAIDLSSELARVTTMLLASGQSEKERLQAARFVAEVMRPGLLEDIVGHQRVRDVLAGTHLHTVVQPITDMHTGEIRLAEALSRFSATPARGPDQWFAEAHRVGLGLQLELAAVRSALDLLPGLPDGIGLSINVAPVVVRSGALLDLIGPANCRRVVLEITEHHAIDPVALAGPIAEARRAGVRIAIDDTGSGYASLSSLLRIKPDIIKIDRDLVRGIDHDPVRRAMVRALVHFSQEDSHAELIAEGIETEAEAATLVNLGVTLGQGYFFGRPVPPARFGDVHRWHMWRGLPVSRANTRPDLGGRTVTV
jgi:EAL domain-containing protein (putative c-di-GMP-specific phosphodiesterase class I)